MVSKATNLDISAFASGNVEEELAQQQQTTPKLNLSPTHATTVPYNSPSLPRDILQYLPPNGNPFSLFGDPFAQLYFLEPGYNVIRNSQYWLRGKEEDNNFTPHEVALLTFISRHRVVTRAQIKCAVFNNEASDAKMKEFIRKNLKNGVIVAFKWVTPCTSDRKLPHLYGLSPAAAKAARDLFNRAYLPRNFQFLPITFVQGKAPKMTEYFSAVIANEFYCKLHNLDRVIDWSAQESYSLPNAKDFRPNYVIKTIKDAQDFKYLWLEVIRPTTNWYTNCISRFQQIQTAFTTLPAEVKPEIVVVLVDDVSRIPDVAELAEHFMPDVVIRYTTDERLIQREDSAIFYQYLEGKGIIPARIRYLTPEWDGMTASEYHASFYNEEMLEEDYDY